MNNNKNDKGFTLVELLIVIVILGILATVTVFAVRGITTEAQDNACTTEIKTLQTSAQAYFASNPSLTAIPGATPAAIMTTLVDAGLLAQASSTYTITDQGVPVPVALDAAGDPAKCAGINP